MKLIVGLGNPEKKYFGSALFHQLHDEMDDAAYDGEDGKEGQKPGDAVDHVVEFHGAPSSTSYIL